MAALWVVACHISVVLKPLLPAGLTRVMFAGYMAVDIFFVLSGFILAVVYVGLVPRDVPFFFAKRLARVYPLNIVLLTVMVAFAACDLPPGIWQYWPTLPWFYTMMESFRPEVVVAWIATSWSVGIEVILYLGFPLLIFALRRLPTPALLALAAGAFAGNFWVQSHYLAAFFGLGALIRGIASFGLGAVLGALAPRLPRPSLPLATLGELAGLAGVAIAVAADALRFLPPSAALLILCLFFDAGVAARLLRGRFWFWQGQISFSVYMLHGPLMADWTTAWRNFHIWVLDPFALATYLPIWLALLVAAFGFVAVVSLLATATWWFVERPGRRLAAIVLPRARVLARG